MDVLAEVIDGDFPEPWKYFDIAEVSVLGEPLIITRTGFTNELGWEFYLRPENNSKKIGDLILSKGEEMGMILTASPGFRCRRIEAGLLSAGRDFTRDRSPFAVGLGKFIDFNKGDFIGRDYLLNASKDCLTWGMRVENSFALVGEKVKKASPK